MRLLMCCVAALALLAGACGDDDDSATGTTTTLGEDTASLEQTCESPDGLTISFPGDWAAVNDCGQFGPAPLEEPAPATDARTGVVSAFIDAVAFERATGASFGYR